MSNKIFSIEEIEAQLKINDTISFVKFVVNLGQMDPILKGAGLTVFGGACRDLYYALSNQNINLVDIKDIDCCLTCVKSEEEYEQACNVFITQLEKHGYTCGKADGKEIERYTNNFLSVEKDTKCLPMLLKKLTATKEALNISGYRLYIRHQIDLVPGTILGFDLNELKVDFNVNTLVIEKWADDEVDPSFSLRKCPSTVGFSLIAIQHNIRQKSMEAIALINMEKELPGLGVSWRKISTPNSTTSCAEQVTWTLDITGDEAKIVETNITIIRLLQRFYKMKDKGWTCHKLPNVFQNFATSNSPCSQCKTLGVANKTIRFVCLCNSCDKCRKHANETVYCFECLIKKYTKMARKAFSSKGKCIKNPLKIINWHCQLCVTDVPFPWFDRTYI